MKNRIIVFFIITFIIFLASANVVLKKWTDNFTEVSCKQSGKDVINSLFKNGGYIYVWGNKGKWLLPPSSNNSEKKSLSEMIEAGDSFFVDEGQNSIFLLKDGKEIQFNIRERFIIAKCKEKRRSHQ